MSTKQLKAIKCPSDELSLTNCAIVNPREFDKIRYILQNEFVILFKKIKYYQSLHHNHNIRHVEITGQTNQYVFSLRADNMCPLGQIGFSAVQVNLKISFYWQLPQFY